jgi:hypothetical protein
MRLRPESAERPMAPARVSVASVIPLVENHPCSVVAQLALVLFPRIGASPTATPGGSVPMETIADHPVIKVLQAEIVRLRKRIESLESHLREEHEKIERLEHEHEHDHEVIERLEHHSPTSYYTGRRTVPLGL